MVRVSVGFDLGLRLGIIRVEVSIWSKVEVRDLVSAMKLTIELSSSEHVS